MDNIVNVKPLNQIIMKSKHTKGEWIIDPRNKLSIIDSSNDLFHQLIAQTNGKSGEERESNAKLIAEAGTVANETGKTPRELAEANKELLEIVIEYDKHLNGLNAQGNLTPTGIEFHEKIKSLIQKHTKKDEIPSL